jgi:hypothetical protein
MADEKTLLTKREAAHYLRCSERSIDRYRALGLVRAVKLRGRVLFRVEDLGRAVAKGVEK